MAENRILIVDDDDICRKNLTRLFQREGFHVSGARDGKTALKRLSELPYDVVMADLVMDDIDGLELLEQIKTRFPDTEVILITGYASIPTAIEAVKKGAYHYLEKPFRPDETIHLVRQAIEKKRLREQVIKLETQLQRDLKASIPTLIGNSRVMVEVVKLIKQVARVNCNVLITGESGTGKELAALMIHYHSQRRNNNFLAINCGGFAEELLANELFGHEKDAFTGASSTRIGLLETASGGTLFLDEIGEMPQSMQVKLLRAIQEQEIIRVGGTRPISIDVRIISATNQDLKKAVHAGLFRRDLYYRLNVVSIDIPPLRKRKEDIPILAHYFLHRTAKRFHRRVSTFSDQAMEALRNYYFPGNVRELENIIEHAVALTRDNTIQLKDLPADLSELEVFSFEASDNKVMTLRKMEQNYIRWVLRRVGHNKTKAAKLLGIDRSSLWRHLKNCEFED
ncbi:MAG: sigma-54-dependent Fis family transcriptional regulator [Deltaproteobacteria bacterium]|nr:sigma-54-dependent Fis family transcriptional regulator [Deltaproteobacteria bacterium]MBW1961933.1 sigma-54-dependent Fis family transcriptional regulator [Deltaproteobacteria bacterium]MBW2150551.1 sigma-54-dependent Fis family transcriptional regulator [Deltaproteobacteria bacterium]